MDHIFWIQTLISFFAGGIAIAGLSIIAEKVPKSISGIVLTLPTNMAVGLFFIGLTSGAATVSQNTEHLPLVLLGSVIYVIIYLLCSNFLVPKNYPTGLNMMASILLASLVWFSIPLAINKIGSPTLWAGVIALIFGIMICQTFTNHLTKKVPVSHIKKTPQGFKVMIIRSLAAGSAVASAVIITKTLGPFWGVAIGSCFPAAYTALLLIFHQAYGPLQTIPLTRTLPIGTIGQIFYILAVTFFYAQYDVWLGTLYAYSLTLVFYLFLAYNSNRLKLNHE